MQKGLRVITLQGAIEKSEWLDGNIIISYFGGSNNIFADCTYNMTFKDFCSKYEPLILVPYIGPKPGLHNT